MKFPINAVIDVLNKITRDIESLSNNMKIKFFKNQIVTKYDLFKYKSSKVKSDIDKKLSQLIKMLMMTYKKRIPDFIKKKRKSVVIRKIISIFLRQSAGSYLRLEDCETLFKAYVQSKEL